MTDLESQAQEFLAVLLDMAGGLAMFLLVAVFYHINSRTPRAPVREPTHLPEIHLFVARKKAIALMLSLVFFGLAAYSLAEWTLDVARVARDGGTPTVDVRVLFYLDLFTVMIFADVVILILSLLLPSYYELVFRNAAFIVSTTLLRLSLAVQKPYDVEIGLLSMAFGNLVLLVYGYAMRSTSQPPDGASTVPGGRHGP